MFTELLNRILDLIGDGGRKQSMKIKAEDETDNGQREFATAHKNGANVSVEEKADTKPGGMQRAQEVTMSKSGIRFKPVRPDIWFEMPLYTDTVDTMIPTIHTIILCLDSKYSLAVAAGLKDDLRRIADPEAAAIEDMGSWGEQRQLYLAWKDGYKLPEVDWNAMKAGVGDSAKQVKKWSEKALDLRTAYGDESITKENCRAFIMEYQFLGEFVDAIGRVRRMKRRISGGMAGVDPRDFLEKQVLNRILRVIRRKRSECYPTVKRFTKLVRRLELSAEKRLEVLCCGNVDEADSVEPASKSRRLQER